MALTIDSAYKELQDLLQGRILLVVGTGASMGLDPRFGMGALSKELQEKIPGSIAGNQEVISQWETVSKKLAKGLGLESALNGVDNESLLEKIVQATGDFVAGLDKERGLNILDNPDIFSLGLLIQKLVDGRPETDPVLNIVTTNYDLLIEHWCDSQKLPYIDGFVGGIRGYHKWDEAISRMSEVKAVPIGKKMKRIQASKRHVRLFKEHGSIHWFIDERTEEIFADHSLAYEKTSNSSLSRFIITPGVSKYRRAFDNFDCFKRADDAITGSDAFIFAGYGFNDTHVQKKILVELKQNKKPGIIITRGLSINIEDLLAQAERVWAVYQHSKNLYKIDESGALIYNRKFKNPLEVKDRPLWKIDCFTRRFWGNNMPIFEFDENAHLLGEVNGVDTRRVSINVESTKLTKARVGGLVAVKYPTGAVEEWLIALVDRVTRSLGEGDRDSEMAKSPPRTPPPRQPPTRPLP